MGGPTILPGRYGHRKLLSRSKVSTWLTSLRPWRSTVVKMRSMRNLWGKESASSSKRRAFSSSWSNTAASSGAPTGPAVPHVVFPVTVTGGSWIATCERAMRRTGAESARTASTVSSGV